MDVPGSLCEMENEVNNTKIPDNSGCETHTDATDSVSVTVVRPRPIIEPVVVDKHTGHFLTDLDTCISPKSELPAVAGNKAQVLSTEESLIGDLLILSTDETVKKFSDEQIRESDVNSVDCDSNHTASLLVISPNNLQMIESSMAHTSIPSGDGISLQSEMESSSPSCHPQPFEVHAHDATAVSSDIHFIQISTVPAGHEVSLKSECLPFAADASQGSQYSVIASDKSPMLDHAVLANDTPPVSEATLSAGDVSVILEHALSDNDTPSLTLANVALEGNTLPETVQVACDPKSSAGRVTLLASSTASLIVENASVIDDAVVLLSNIAEPPSTTTVLSVVKIETDKSADKENIISDAEEIKQEDFTWEKNYQPNNCNSNSTTATTMHSEISTETNKSEDHEIIMPEERAVKQEDLSWEGDQQPNNYSENQSSKTNCLKGKIDGQCNACFCEVGVGDGDDLQVQLKQEPVAWECEKPELQYRNKSLVVYSDNDGDTSSIIFTDSDGGYSEGDGHITDEEIVERLNARKITMSKNRSRTEGEVFPEELPPLEYLTISPDEGVELESLGTVSGIVDVLVVVRANLNSPALFDDTVLFLEGRQPLGLIFETFGTVEQTFYSIRFNSNKDIKERGIEVGDKVMFAPKADNLTKYIFIAELRKIKCDDASWEYDNEPPAAHVEFSDDEEEKRAKQRQRNRDRGLDDNSEGGRRKKRKKKFPMDQRKETQGPQLLPGGLMRNPFGNKGQLFTPPASSHNTYQDKQSQKGGCQTFHNSSTHFPPRLPPPPPPSPTFHQPWPSSATFGENLEWKHQPGLLGNSPNISTSTLQCFGGIRNSSFLSHGQMRTPSPRFGGMPFYPPPPCPPVCSPNFNFPIPSHPMSSPMNVCGGGGPYFPPPSFHLPPPPSPPCGNPHAMPTPNFPIFSPSRPPPIINPACAPPPPPPPPPPTSL